MQSAWHNCPTINGQMQSAGRSFEARNFSAIEGGVSMEIQNAYPEQAGLQHWLRSVALDRAAGHIVLRESFRLSRRESIEWDFITNRVARLAAPGRMVLDGRFVLSFDPALEAVFDEHSSEDARLRPIWDPRVRRARLLPKSPRAQAEYTFTLSVG